MGYKAVVLVIEDEVIIRMNIVQVAQDLGFEVLEAANADEAIEILESHDNIRATGTGLGAAGASSPRNADSFRRSETLAQGKGAILKAKRLAVR